MRMPSWLVAALLVLHAPLTVHAQKVPVGPVFQANQTVGGQPGDFHGPDVASDAAGNFVVVWQDRYGYTGIFGRRYDANGQPITAEFNVSTPGYGTSPAVASDAAGNFVVVWEDYDAYGFDTDVFARRYDTNGGPQGPAFTVNAETPYGQTNPKIASDPAGNFVVVWAQYSDPFIHGRRFDASGTPLGGDFEVNAVPDLGLGYNGIDEDPDGIEIAANPAGRIMVVWQAWDSDGDAYGLTGRLFDENGAPLTSDFQVNSYTTGYQNYPGIAADGLGNFIVSWGGEGPGGVGPFVRRFDQDGGALGTEFRAGTDTTSFYGGKVAADAAGNAVVVWTTDYEVKGRRFDATGTPLGPEFKVMPFDLYSYQALRPAVASNADGDFVVVWQDRYRNTYGGIFGQRFAEAGPCAPAPKPGCHAPFVGQRGVFRFSEGSTDAHDQLVWQWDRGTATAPNELGDPFTTTAYALCVYDASAAPQPLLAARAPAGGTCGTRPCWRTLNAGRLEYKDSAATSDGIFRLRLTPGADGDAHVTVLARGVNLALPGLPLTPPVTVQVQASNDTCFTATYDTLITANANGRFRATPDP